MTFTDLETEVGRIAALTSGATPGHAIAETNQRPARIMVAVGITITLILAAAMLARGSSTHEAFLVGVSVAVAAVPEGLAATVTIALALGARAMARRSNRPTSVGCGNARKRNRGGIRQDGNAHQERARLAATAPAAGVDERRLLVAGALASTAKVIEENGFVRIAGDPVDGAFLLGARSRYLAEVSQAREPPSASPFDSSQALNGRVQEPHGDTGVASKAPQVIFERSALDEQQRADLRTARELGPQRLARPGRRSSESCRARLPR